MKTSERVLEILEKSAGSCISGEELAKTLDISRNSVWKAVQTLIGEGFEIEAAPHRGYRFASCNDIISKSAIAEAIDPDKRSFFEIEIRESVTSTNTVLKELASNGEREGHVLIALSQTAGKGRVGRSFYSPKGSGVYFSLLLRPALSPNDTALITCVAAVALCLALKETLSVDTCIKWVNDVYFKNKKICGILTEASLDLNFNSVEYAVLGVGINIYPPEGGFPSDIQEVAGSLVSVRRPFAQSRVIGRFLSEFYTLYFDFDPYKISSLYRKFNFTTGKKIDVISKGAKRPATALAIDDRCRLIVRYEDTGEQDILQAGEISIRHSKEGEDSEGR